jgi:hypothetical protein
MLFYTTVRYSLWVFFLAPRCHAPYIIIFNDYYDRKGVCHHSKVQQVKDVVFSDKLAGGKEVEMELPQAAVAAPPPAAAVDESKNNAVHHHIVKKQIEYSAVFSLPTEEESSVMIEQDTAPKNKRCLQTLRRLKNHKMKKNDMIESPAVEVEPLSEVSDDEKNDIEETGPLLEIE